MCPFQRWHSSPSIDKFVWKLTHLVVSYRRSIRIVIYIFNQGVALTCETPAAIIAPMWIIGPSLPRGRPDEHEKIMPIALQSNVLNRTNRGIFRPFRKHLISGIPFKKNVSFPYTSIMYGLGVFFFKFSNLILHWEARYIQLTTRLKQKLYSLRKEKRTPSRRLSPQISLSPTVS